VRQQSTAQPYALFKEGTDQGKCIRGSGLTELGAASAVAASVKSASVMECVGAVEANQNAAFDGEFDAVGGIRNRDEDSHYAKRKAVLNYVKKISFFTHGMYDALRHLCRLYAARHKRRKLYFLGG
jgi:hypothetical protein